MPKFLGIRRRAAARAAGRRFKRSKLSRKRFTRGVKKDSGMKNTYATTGNMPGTLVIRPWGRHHVSPFPESMPLHVKYQDIERNMACTTGGVVGSSYLYRVNDIFDPYNGVGGGGPINWNTQLSAIYNKYIIWGVTIQITAFNPSQNTLVVGCLLHATDDADDPSGKTADYMMQRENYEIIPLTSLSGSGSTGTISKYVFLPKIEGISLAQWVGEAEKYGASFGADPALPMYLRLGVSDRTGANTGSADVQVSLTFHGKAYARKTAS